MGFIGRSESGYTAPMNVSRLCECFENIYIHTVKILKRNDDYYPGGHEPLGENDCDGPVAKGEARLDLREELQHGSERDRGRLARRVVPVPQIRIPDGESEPG